MKKQVKCMPVLSPPYLLYEFNTFHFNPNFSFFLQPPVPRYGIPPHRGNAPTYPPYPHPTNQYPPRYNQPQQVS